MLELKSIAWRNFMSYGDYETVVDLNNLGQCLITGEVIDGDKALLESSVDMQISKSNGAGKSTIVNVIQWALFGRTMHSGSPGDKVINYFTGKDCIATLTFKNGDFITRTRNVNGNNELYYVKDGNEFKLAGDTLSTAKNQQAQLNRAFGLDWELFCGSVFFNQYGKPWMEMAEPTRKKTIERALHVDKFTYRANNAKGKCEVLDRRIESLREQINTHIASIARLGGELERLETASQNYGANRDKRVAEALQHAVEEKSQRDAIQRPDLAQLQTRWEVVKQVELQIDGKRNALNSLTRTIAGIEGSIDSLRRKIKIWHDKTDSVCNACEQTVPADHTAAKIDPIQQQLDVATASLAAQNTELDKLRNIIQIAEQQLAERKPKMTMRAAKDLHESWERHDKAITRLKNDAVKIRDETNPHNAAIKDTQESIEKTRDEIAKLEKEIEHITFLNKHYAYIYKAYNDRTKIKSFVFQEHVPFINSRLRHYLDVFGLDIQIELTPALGVSSNMWGYEFESGGERKRTDVAFMLAMFDFHEQMYGRQCNILVLDEVDGRLDDDGIDSLINIIKNDLAPKVETVLIISHRNLMRDTFASEVRVTRSGRFSHLVGV